MAHNGWIKLHRQLLDSKWGSNLEMVGLFTTLLMLANHKPAYTHDGTLVSPGQLMTSKFGLGMFFGHSESKIRRMLSKLESDGQISVKSSNKNTIITISNWDKFQRCDDDGDEQTANKRRSIEEQPATNKNDNNNKNVINKNICDVTHDDAKAVIKMFNEICGKNYRGSKADNQKITARFSEGFVLNDFEMVIRAKHEAWSENPAMAEFVRPMTLFGTKFEGYLQAAKNKPKTFEDKLHDFFTSQGVNGNPIS